MSVYKMLIAYDGTAYSGWQVQPNGTSVQQLIHRALKLILKSEEITITGSGRTDAGVHAKGQVAHFRHEKAFDLHRLLGSLNGLLPPDIRIRAIEPAPASFHARYSAIGKEYHYYLHLDRVADPFQRLYKWHIHYPVDEELLFEACYELIGTHDFTSFANEAHSGAAAHNPIRTLYRADAISVEGGLRLEFEGNGFLYKMVRNMVGALVEIGAKKRPLSDIRAIFEAKDRRRAGQSAPPHGLFLMRVDYPVEMASNEG